MPNAISAPTLQALMVWCGRVLRATPLACAMIAGAPTTAAAAATPQIRTSASNKVPACVTPQRLMAFLKMRNRELDPRFQGIAELYRRHGETWHVRWDYAFFQMAVETNFLTFRQGNGRWGDVNPRQNNFAGLGTTGGGVAGDRYPDVSTGVLAQIQHLVVYSGERIAAPVGARTQLKQDDILESMASYKGRTTFGDLARRWAADRHYGASIEWVANSYRSTFCRKPEPPREPERAPEQRRPREANNTGELPRAAALGGPSVVAAPAIPLPKPQPAVRLAAADAGASVRTIWSAAEAGGQALASTPAPAPLQLPPPVAKAKRTVSPWVDSEESAEGPPSQPAAAAIPSPEPAHRPAEPVPPPHEVDTATRPHAVPVSVAASAETAPASPAQAASQAEPAKTSTLPPTTAAPAQTQARDGAFAFAVAMNYEELTASREPEQAPAQRCRVTSASYGGTKTLLVLTQTESEVRYTALTVLDGFEGSMLANYVKAHAPGGVSVGEFESKEAAIAKAMGLCSGNASARQARAAG